MKKIFIIIILITNYHLAIGQETFVKVEINKNLELAKIPLDQIPYKKAVERRINIEVESYDFQKKSDSLIYTNLHPFVAALHYAFAEHRPVVISPDMVWLLINQSFAIHINQNPEKYRNRFVNFENKKSISVIRNDFRKGLETNPWIEVFPVFSDSIKKYIGDSIHQILTPNFSTTSIIEKSAYEISLMDLTSNYFDFDMKTFCGIPYIKLQGKPSDWKWILDHLEFFESFGLDFWIARIRPILKEIYNTSKGKQNKEFWKDIYKWHQSSGANYVDGWIANFFLYTITDSNKYKLNWYVERNHDSIVAEFKKRAQRTDLGGITGNQFPSGLSKVEFKWYYMLDPIDTFSMELYSGFIGISQDTKTLELIPEISFGVVDKANKKLKSEEFTIIDQLNPSCESFLYAIHDINQPPLFQSGINSNEFHSNQKDFEEFINRKLVEKYPNKGESTLVEIKFTVTSVGEIQNLVINSKLNQEIINFLNGLIVNTKGWRPAIKNDEPCNYDLRFSFWY